MAKVKQFLGIGGVKVVVTVPGEAAKDRSQVEGTITVSTKSDQQVQELVVKLVEHWTSGRGDNKTTKEFELGTVKLPGLALKSGESREVPFTLPFVMLKSGNDKLKEKGGVLGALGKAGAFMDGEKSVYRLTASASVKGTAFNPSSSKDIKIV
jgi:hypothetical protein